MNNNKNIDIDAIVQAVLDELSKQGKDLPSAVSTAVSAAKKGNQLSLIHI